MNTNETRKEVVIGTLKDGVLVAVYSGLTLIEFKIYRKVNLSNLTKIEQIVASTVLFGASIENAKKAFDKTKSIYVRVRDYRNKNMEERRSELEGMFNDYCNNDYVKEMNEAFEKIVKSFEESEAIEIE